MLRPVSSSGRRGGPSPMTDSPRRTAFQLVTKCDAVVKEGAMVPIRGSQKSRTLLVGVRRCVGRLGWPALLGSLLLWPGMAAAQSTIAGAARDTTGAVLPGATVEASSPALIEVPRSRVPVPVALPERSGSGLGDRALRLSAGLAIHP